MKIFQRSAAFLVPTCLTLALAGCAVGPDFQRPRAPEAAGYVPGAAPAAPAGDIRDGIRFEAGGDISAQWWTLFRSPALNALVDRALAANPDLAAAQAALRQARENVEVQRGLFFPAVQASYSPSRTKVAGNNGSSAPGLQGNGTVIEAPDGAALPVIYNFHTAQLSVGYAPDVFGGTRRLVESTQAQAEAQRYATEAARITLASHVVAAAIQEASLRAQIKAAEGIVAANARALEVLRRQYRAGYAGAADLAAQENAAAQAEQLLPPLTTQLQQIRDLIRVLAGNPPDRDVAETFDLASLHLPDPLPLSLPAELVRQRPDIRAAEEQLHAATAQVGVAAAARWPQFSLTAAMGGEASHFDQMFWNSGKFFSVVGGVSQTLFDGGASRHRQRAAEAAMEQAEALYRSTVLGAFQNVADTLHALQGDTTGLAAATRAEAAARKTFELVRRQKEAGYADVLTLGSAEQAWNQSALTLAQARAAQLGDAVALFQALGGGWWNRADSQADNQAGTAQTDRAN